MLQKILNCLIKDEIEETKKLVRDINRIASFVPLLMFTSSTIMLSNLESSKCLLERLEKEESEIELKLSKTCFCFASTILGN